MEYKPEQFNAIVIRRVDVLRVHDYARQQEPLRNYLIIRLPKQIGLRSTETAMLKIEDINFEDRNFYVLDSKRKQFYPLPLDGITLDLIQELVGDRKEGYVFEHLTCKKRVGQPLTKQEIWHLTREMGLRAGVKGFNPRQLRAFFAANWAIVEHKNLEVLRRILRHKSLTYTQIYVSRLTFWEDIEKEYHSIQNVPFAEMPKQLETTQPALAICCRDCDRLPICKYADQTPQWVTGCKFKPDQIQKAKVFV